MVSNNYITETPRAEQDRGRVIRTFTGKYVNPLAMQPDDICIEDIAHHLSNECRYAGAMPEYYSVAQHSVLVSRCFNSADWRLAGLLHDAAEAYLKDIPSPVKHDPRMQWYVEIENRLLHMIFRKFNLSPSLLLEVKAADKKIFKQEVQSFWGARDLFNCIRPASPREAEMVFLNEFNWIRGGMQQ